MPKAVKEKTELISEQKKTCTTGQERTILLAERHGTTPKQDNGARQEDNCA